VKLSIVLSTYNGEKYILEQLQSLMNQSRPADEVLIFDDCSTDDTATIIREFLDKNALLNWKLCVNKQNKGWRRNFIEGIQAAKGDLIFTCDQDDIWLSSKLELMEETMKNNPNINLLVSHYIEFYEDGSEKVCPRPDTGNVSRNIKLQKFMNIVFPGCTYCVRKNFAEKCIRYWWSTLPHDALLWRWALFHGSLAILETVLIKQRKHSESTFTKEAKKMKTLVAKREELQYTLDNIEALTKFLNDENDHQDSHRRVLANADKWVKARKKWFDKHNIFQWIYLLRYIGFYPTCRRYILDLYVVIFQMLRRRK